MGRQFYTEFTSFGGNTWRCEIHSDAAALDYELDALNNPVIQCAGEGDDLFTNPIRSSRAMVSFIARDENDYGNLMAIGLTNSDEQQYELKIYKNGTEYWIGRILGDQMTFKHEPREVGYASISITAVDGLELLSQYDVDPGWFTSGRATYAYVVVQILNMLGLSDEIDNTTSYLKASVLHTNSNIGGSYGVWDSQIRDLSFVKNGDPFKISDKIEWMNCKEALEQILIAFNARLIHDQGSYWIYQPAMYPFGATVGQTFTYDSYNNSGTNTAYATTYTHRKVLTDTAGVRPKWGAFPELTYQPPLRYTAANFDRMNGQIATKTTQNTTAITCTHNNIVATASAPGRAIKIDIDIDFSYYASLVTKYEIHRTYYADDGAGGTKYQPIGGTWASVSSLSADIETYYDGPMKGFLQRNFKKSIELIAPPTGQTNVVCEVKVKKIVGYISRSLPYPGVTWSTPATSDFEFTGTVVIMQAYNTSTPWEYTQPYKIQSDIDAPGDTNSVHKEIEVKYYNGKKYDVGSILVKSGASTWIEAANDWEAPWTAYSGDLPGLVADTISGVYSEHKSVIKGMVHDSGTYNVLDSWYFDSTIWVFNGGEHNLHDDTINGQWVGVELVYTLVNNGTEGERVQKKEELIEDGLKQINTDFDKIREIVGAMPLSILPMEIINNATGAPSSDPGVDKEYNLSLYYDYDATTPTLAWKLNEAKKKYSFVTADSPVTITEKSGEVVIIADTSGGNITVNLPTMVNNTATYYFKKVHASNTLTIDPNSTETIDGAGTATYTALNSKAMVISDGANAIIIS